MQTVLGAGRRRSTTKMQSLIESQHPNQSSSSSSSSSSSPRNINRAHLPSPKPTHEEQSHGWRKKKKNKTSTEKHPSEITSSNSNEASNESPYRRIKMTLHRHIKTTPNMRCFKHIFLACVPHKGKQVAPKVSPSPPGPTSPRPVLNRAPTSPRPVLNRAPTSPVKLARTLSHKREFAQFNEEKNKEGANRSLNRAASMGSRGQRASAFARSKTMSSKAMRSDSETPRMHRSVSRSRQSQPIVLSTSSGLLKPLQVEYMLECTLDELCFGCVKQINVSRAVVTSTGSVSKDEELLTVNVKPGWTKGTKITFPGGEDKEARSHSGDIVFVVVEKEDNRLKRRDEHEHEGDLETEIVLPLVDAISGCNLCVPLIGGGQLILFGDDIIETGFERVIQGQGMPKKKDPSQRGDLKIKFRVEFPKSLSDSQRSEILKILSD